MYFKSKYEYEETSSNSFLSQNNINIISILSNKTMSPLKVDEQFYNFYYVQVKA